MEPTYNLSEQSMDHAMQPHTAYSEILNGLNTIDMIELLGLLPKPAMFTSGGGVDDVIDGPIAKPVVVDRIYLC